LDGTQAGEEVIERGKVRLRSVEKYGCLEDQAVKGMGVGGSILSTKE
jgi:hypothetical protein